MYSANQARRGGPDRGIQGYGQSYSPYASQNRPLNHSAARGGGEGGYAPVDPYKASLALGIKKLFGNSKKDRTIDEVPVASSPVGAPPPAPRPPAHIYAPSPVPPPRRPSPSRFQYDTHYASARDPPRREYRHSRSYERAYDLGFAYDYRSLSPEAPYAQSRRRQQRDSPTRRHEYPSRFQERFSPPTMLPPTIIPGSLPTTMPPAPTVLPTGIPPSQPPIVTMPPPGPQPTAMGPPQPNVIIMQPPSQQPTTVEAPQIVVVPQPARSSSRSTRRSHSPARVPVRDDSSASERGRSRSRRRSHRYFVANRGSDSGSSSGSSPSPGILWKCRDPSTVLRSSPLISPVIVPPTVPDDESRSSVGGRAASMLERLQSDGGVIPPAPAVLFGVRRTRRRKKSGKAGGDVELDSKGNENVSEGQPRVASSLAEDDDDLFPMDDGKVPPEDVGGKRDEQGEEDEAALERARVEQERERHLEEQRRVEEMLAAQARREVLLKAKENGKSEKDGDLVDTLIEKLRNGSQPRRKHRRFNLSFMGKKSGGEDAGTSAGEAMPTDDVVVEDKQGAGTTVVQVVGSAERHSRSRSSSHRRSRSPRRRSTPPPIIIQQPPVIPMMPAGISPQPIVVQRSRSRRNRGRRSRSSGSPRWSPGPSLHYYGGSRSRSRTPPRSRSQSPSTGPAPVVGQLPMGMMPTVAVIRSRRSRSRSLRRSRSRSRPRYLPTIPPTIIPQPTPPSPVGHPPVTRYHRTSTGRARRRSYSIESRTPSPRARRSPSRSRSRPRPRTPPTPHVMMQPNPTRIDYVEDIGRRQENDLRWSPRRRRSWSSDRYERRRGRDRERDRGRGNGRGGVTRDGRWVRSPSTFYDSDYYERVHRQGRVYRNGGRGRSRVRTPSPYPRDRASPVRPWEQDLPTLGKYPAPATQAPRYDWANEAKVEPVRYEVGVVDEKAESFAASEETLRVTWYAIVVTLFFNVIPAQIYLHFLLRFPSLYFSRVTRIFRDADLGMGEIKRMALEAMEHHEGEYGESRRHGGDVDLEMKRVLIYQGIFPQEHEAAAPVEYVNLRNSWQAFIDALMREWKTFNIISVLLLSAILTILQIDEAASNPLTRYSALLSLVCAFMSLLYGCIYIIRFGTMRKTHKAAEWANESERSSTSIFWNVWVMLSMPAVWLGWSMIFYIICVMSFVWQTGPTALSNIDLDPSQTRILTDTEILVPRIIISLVLALGLVYLMLIGITFQRYSDPMEEAWRQRIRGWLAEKAQAAAVAGFDDSQATRHEHAHGGGAGGGAWGTYDTYGHGTSKVSLKEKTEGRMDGGAEKHDFFASAVNEKKGGSWGAEKEMKTGGGGAAPPLVMTLANFAAVQGVEKEKAEVKEKGGVGMKKAVEMKEKHVVGVPKGLGLDIGIARPPSSPPLPAVLSSIPTMKPGVQVVPAPTASPKSSVGPMAGAFMVSEGVYAVSLEVPTGGRRRVDHTRGDVEEMKEVLRLDAKGVKAPHDAQTADDGSALIPKELAEKGMLMKTWNDFNQTLATRWKALHESPRDEEWNALVCVLSCIDEWNAETLLELGMFLALVQYHPKGQTSGGPPFTVPGGSKPAYPCGLYLGTLGSRTLGVRRDIVGVGDQGDMFPLWSYHLTAAFSYGKAEKLPEIVGIGERRHF